MADIFFHGVEVQEVTSGARPVQTIRTSVIGLVGTAPNATPDTKAVLDLGTAAANNGLRLTSKLVGVLGNDIAVELVNPAGNSQSLSVDVVGKTITISLATSSAGAITTTATTLKAAIEADADAHALVGITALGASTGAGVVAAAAAQALTGGVNEPFPLNTPIEIVGRRPAGLGSTGTIPDALDDIFMQAGAVVVVVRVAEGANDAATLANIIGGINEVTGAYEGVQALLAAESQLALRPRILIAPGFTHQRSEGSINTVVSALLVVADRLRGVVPFDGPNTTDAEARLAAKDHDSGRAYLVDPWLVRPDANGNPIHRPPSAAVAGLIAQVDDGEGFWVSPSNHVVKGFSGLSRPVDYTAGDANSRANLLNEANVATFIREGGGLRLWGNRTLSSDAKWAFLSVRRIADAINESVQRAHLWAVDRNITRTYVDDVTESVNAYLRQLTSLGAILGGDCWADGDLNTPAAYAQGKVFFNFRFTPSTPAEHIIFRSHVVNDFVTDLFD